MKANTTENGTKEIQIKHKHEWKLTSEKNKLGQKKLKKLMIFVRYAIKT